MGSYNPVERRVATFLDRYPAVKDGLKSLYQRGNYYAFGDRSFEYDLHPEVELTTPDEGFGVSIPRNELLFGYFDVSPWDRSMERALYHAPRPGGDAEVVLYGRGHRRTLASTETWNHQQGSRLQWHPTHDDRVLFNDSGSDGDRSEEPSPGEGLVTRIVGTDGVEHGRFSMPVQAMSPTGDEFLSLSYRRLDRNRPDYGYGVGDESSLLPPDRDGLWRVETDDGSPELLVSLSDLVEETPNESADGTDHHYVNHALYDPTGERAVFMHRWKGAEGRTSRLYLVDRDGGNRRLLMDDRIVSHYCWLDADRLFVWGRSEEYGSGYHVLYTQTGDLEYVDALDGYGDGHPSLSPDGRWIVTDTYPDRTRKRSLVLYNLESEETVTIGTFFAPLAFEGELRCDLHPRFSPDGTSVSIDSAHDGRRYSYLLDIGSLVEP
jgi:hypothetical protein